jgi:hypothetical protein
MNAKTTTYVTEALRAVEALRAEAVFAAELGETATVSVLLAKAAIVQAQALAVATA